MQVGEPCIDRQRFNISRRTSMTSQGITGHHTSSPTQEDLFQRASFYTTYLQQCPRSPTRRHTNVANFNQQQQASVTWVARQSSELEPEPMQPPQNSNTLSPRPQGGSQKQRINRRRRQKPGTLFDAITLIHTKFGNLYPLSTLTLTG